MTVITTHKIYEITREGVQTKENDKTIAGKCIVGLGEVILHKKDGQ
jgi:hypothetical protein